MDMKSDSLNLVRRAGIKIAYVSGKAAIADLVKDVIQIGGRAIHDALFGIAVATNFEYNVLGLGYAANEAVVEGNPPYKNFLQMMKEDGLIKSAAYSLSLNSQNVGGGSILFGGIDAGKFKGKLKTLAIQGDRREIVINVSETSFAGKKRGSFSAVLDAGQTRISVADELAKTIWAAAGIKSLDRNGDPVRSCALSDAESNMAFVFKFGGTIIRVPMSELIIPDSTEPGAYARLDEGSCYFGVFGSGGDIAVLGMPFLRSAYVVFNLERNEISVAPQSFSRGGKIREIADGGVTSLGALADGVDDGTLNAENSDFGSGDNSMDIINAQPLGADGSIGTAELGGTSIPNRFSFTPDLNAESAQVATSNPVDNPSSGGSDSTTRFDSSIFSSTGSNGYPNFSISPDATGAKTQQPNQGPAQVLGVDVSTQANSGGTMNPNSSPPAVQGADTNTQFQSQADPTNWVTPSGATPGFQVPNQDSTIPALTPAIGNNNNNNINNLAFFSPGGSNNPWSGR